MFVPTVLTQPATRETETQLARLFARGRRDPGVVKGAFTTRLMSSKARSSRSAT